MGRLALAILACSLGCTAPRAPGAPRPPAPPVTEAPTPAPAATPVSPWPVAMRVMTWTPDGAIQIGELPGAPPAALPATPWYVEPIEPLDPGDRATFERVIAAVRVEQVPGLSLRGQPVERWLGALRELPALRALILDDTAVDGRALAEFELGLARLYLARTAVDDAAVGALAARWPALEVLDLEGTAIGDPAAAAIARLGELRAVNLAGTRLGDAGGAQLGALGKLEIVDLGRTRVGARTIAALRGLAVRELFLDGTRAGKELATLAGFAPGIRRFDASSLDGYKPTDADLAWLAHAPELVELGLSGSKVTDRLALAVARAPALRRIRLAATPITRATIRALAARGDLEEVDLGETPVDDPSAAALLASPAIRMLRLDRTPIRDAALRGPAGPRLAELYLSHTSVGDPGLAILDQLPHLAALGLGHTRAGDPTLARIARLAELRTLVLTAVPASHDALLDLGALRGLERLYLDETDLDDEVLAELAPLRRLRVLHLTSTPITNESLPVLRGFPALEELSVGHTRLDAAITTLVAMDDAWPRLHTLSLLGLRIDDAAAARLARRRRLAVLDLSRTDVRDPTPLAQLPELRLLGVVATPLSPAGLATTRRLAARGVEIVR